jgi:hypothetical protein
MKPLTESEVTFTVECEPESDSIEGNASAIDPETDAATEAWILGQLGSGNEWAWCTVRVRAEWRGMHGDAYLGQCSYEGREQFMADGYYDDMRAEALASLNEQVARVQRDA